jgi:hypothetical protein
VLRGDTPLSVRRAIAAEHQREQRDSHAVCMSVLAKGMLRYQRADRAKPASRRKTKQELVYRSVMDSGVLLEGADTNAKLVCFICTRARATETETETIICIPFY